MTSTFRSPFYFLVKPLKGKRYSNTVDIAGIELISSVDEEDHRFSNRFAEVIATPIGYDGDIDVGDTMVVHHNVFKYYYDMSGMKRSGRSWLFGDVFFVDFDQFFLYKKPGGEWKTHSKYCFVKPLEEPLVGEVVYSNIQLDEVGISEGDVISYQPDSEYEFRFDEGILYRMFTNNIAIKLNNGSEEVKCST